MAAMGRALARAHGQACPPDPAHRFVTGLSDHLRVLRDAQGVLERQQHAGSPLPPAAQSLQDHLHEVMLQTRAALQAQARCAGHPLGHLAVLAGSGLCGMPRVYALAWHFVAHTDGAFDADLLVTLLRAYQELFDLTHAELWALPDALRLVLLENLRRLAERVATEEAAREAAHQLCDALALPGLRMDITLARLGRLRTRGVADAFWLQIMQRLDADEHTGVPPGIAVRQALRAALARALPQPAAVMQAQQGAAADDTLSIDHAIDALRQLEKADWRAIVTPCSMPMQTLLAWPAFAAEHAATQDISLQAIERLAHRCQLSEADVARRLLALAGASTAGAGAPTADTALAALARDVPEPPVGPGHSLEHSLGHWLMGAGRPLLEAELGLAPAWWPSLRPAALATLLATLATLTGALTLGVMHMAAAASLGRGAWAGLALLAALPASEVISALLNRVLAESLPPRPLPRLALRDGIEPTQRVLVVLPVVLDSRPTVMELAQRLERHYLANRESQAQFALLGDFADADSASMADDEPVLHEALARIDALNARHPEEPSGPLRFVLLQRVRRWSESEQCWMGWERKRGKLEALMALLSGDPSTFMDLGMRSRPAAGTRYVLTLDSDTQLPPGSLRELIAVAAHPLNQPQIGRARGGPLCVVSGHAILQPQLCTSWPDMGKGSAFQWLTSGASAGHEAYNSPASELYQDLFGEGSFCGKGLLDVAAVRAVLGGRLPEGQVLSHDLLEGCLARCGSVADICLLEPAARHADVASARLHRWTRGDWQLLPLLLHARRHGLNALSQWKLLDNLRRSLVAPAALGVLLLALGGIGLAPWAALALAAAAFGAAPLLGALAGLAPGRDDLALLPFARMGLAECARTLALLAWQLALWLQQAVLVLHAIACALWRSMVSHRRLLAWTTAAMSERSASHALGAQLVDKAAVSLLALAILGALLALGTPAPGLALALCLIWAATPLWVTLGSRTLRHAVPPLRDDERAYLLGVARQTWSWFAAQVGPASHHLPPDNVQALPHLIVAQRTSPTNIGMYLLAAACAHAFGWITTAEWADRLGATLDTLERLPKERGHLLNWIVTDTLQPLQPAYVSTVDSGNLCGHLLAVAGACDQAGDAHRDRLDALARRCRQLADGMDFGFLYDPRRRLLHIGWQVSEQTLDPGHYDLLASESRLASLWAIAKGDVPPVHWATLARAWLARGSAVGMTSWTGSMFEYLMPQLVLEEPAGSLLGCAARLAVQEQRRHGHQHRMPWGVSESAYAATDLTLAYQYAPHGVPGLALRRTPADEHVVAPYASALAALWVPRAAVANLRRLQALRMRTPWGFFEALDFTPARQSALAPGLAPQLAAPFGLPPPGTRVQSWMAHHQGMTVVALAQVLLDGQPRRWAMADARLAAVAMLLHERVPREVPRRRTRSLPAVPPSGTHGVGRGADALPGDVQPGSQALPRTQLLGNSGYRDAGAPGDGSRCAYSVSLRANGAGWSRHGDIDIGRWRDDALRDQHGHFLYLRRSAQATPVSLTQHPAADPVARYSARMLPDRVCLDAQWPDLNTRCTVWVSPENDIELRRVDIVNRSSASITLSLLSAFEVSLCAARDDEMHPAFAKLFISARWEAHLQALLLTRQPHREGERHRHAAHFIAHTEACGPGTVQALADRARWLGRLRGPGQPRADFGLAPTASGPLDTGLDPVAALSLTLTLPPNGCAQVTWATAAAPDAATLVALVERHRRPGAVALTAQRSATLHALRQRERPLAADDQAAIQTLTTLMVMLHTRPAVQPSGLPGLPGPPGDRRLLWRHGLSGDRPLLVVTIASLAGLPLVNTLVQGLRIWTDGGVGVDLVLVNTEPDAYLRPLASALRSLRERCEPHLQRGPALARGALVLLAASELTPLASATLHQAARVRLNADGRPLPRHVRDLLAWHESARRQREQNRRDPAAAAPQPADAPAAAGAVGAVGFDPHDGHYTFVTSLARPAPRPWVNLMANPEFGSLLTDSGAGWSWAGNSRLHQISAWSNDPLTDTAGEHIALHDLDNGQVWNLAPGAGAAAVDYRVEHGPGGSRISHHHGNMTVTLHWQVDPELAARRLRITLTNTSGRPRQLRVLAAIEWLLGTMRVDRQSVCTSHARIHATGRAAVDVLLATQPDPSDGAPHDGGAPSAFWALRADGGNSHAAIAEWTCDRRELFDERGELSWPRGWSQLSGQGADPCAALGLVLQVPAGGTRGVEVLLGHAGSAPLALALARRLLHDERGRPQVPLDGLRLHSPDPLFNTLVNHWLPHQSLTCRMWARAGFYQAGGAYGFRDQLQDAMALVLTAPAVLRQHVLRAAARQFSEGDVQHWWHPHSGAGVRTRCSDDLLWLPHAVHHYVTTTGDAAVLDESVPFLHGKALAEGAEDDYRITHAGSEVASLYEHCARAIDARLQVGAHGLPLMGSGDWNDSMNAVGAAGRGESVWLGWFLCRVTTDMTPLARARGDRARAIRWQRAERRWRVALQRHGWDGQWYARAFFDDGTPLGTQAAAEGRIDLITQAWSVLSGAAPLARQTRAMAAAAQHLRDTDWGLLRLLDPPLARQQPWAGYIQAYPPGVRENGGQYTHAVVWAAMAWARLGQADAAWQAWQSCSPAHRAADPVLGPRYGLEPYAVAADICSQPPWTGRGGWSWYTGSAAGLYRAAIESICGLQVRGRHLRFVPALPGHWPALTLSLHRHGRTLHFSLCRADAVSALAAAHAAPAQPLAVGEWLDTEADRTGSDYLIVLPAAPPAGSTPT